MQLNGHAGPSQAPCEFDVLLKEQVKSANGDEGAGEPRQLLCPCRCCVR